MEAKARKTMVAKVKERKKAEEWEIWNRKEKIAKLEKEVKKLVLLRFHKYIYVFGKKASERIKFLYKENYKQ